MINLKKNNSLVRKIGFLFVLAILLQIPIFFIHTIVDDRGYCYFITNTYIFYSYNS